MPIIPLPERVERVDGPGAPLDAEPQTEADLGLPAEGFALDTTGERPRIAAADDAGEAAETGEE